MIVLALQLKLERSGLWEDYYNTVIHNFSYLRPVKAQICACVFTPAVRYMQMRPVYTQHMLWRYDLHCRYTVTVNYSFVVSGPSK